MSPNEVRARISTVLASGSGVAAASRLLWTRPNLVRASTHAMVPFPIPIETLPDPVARVDVPVTTSPIWMFPLAVLAATSVPTWSTAMSPLADLARSRAETWPTQVLPFRFLMSAFPPIETISMSPPAVTSPSPAAWLRETLPAPVTTLTWPVSSSRTSPAPFWMRVSASLPSARRSASPPLNTNRDASGSSMVTSTEPLTDLGTFTMRVLPERSMRVRCAASASSLREGSLGLTTTVVSERSLAMRWAAPKGSSITAKIGSGVLKELMSAHPTRVVVAGSGGPPLGVTRPA